MFLLHQDAGGLLYSHATDFVRISVVPTFHLDASNPAEQQFVWSYSVYIENRRDEAVKLIERRWQVIDACGQKEDIHGPEVIGSGIEGYQPVIKAGALYQHSNDAYLHTSSGIVRGSCRFKGVESGEEWDVEVPAFSLDSPYLPYVVN